MRTALDQARTKQFGAFTTRQALGEYTPAELRAHLERGEWARVFPGVYRATDTPPSPELRVEAARLSLGTTSLVAAYHTAAELHGFAVCVDRPTEVLGLPASRSNRLVVHGDRVDAEALDLVRGIVTTTAPRTAVDLARTLPRVDALATLDAAVRAGVPRAALVDELERHAGRRGYRNAAQLIELCDARSESATESRARLRCLDAGLPLPEPQLELPTPHGPHRFDLGWRVWQIGLDLAACPRGASENVRRTWLTTEGWIIFRATVADVYHHPHHFTAPIRDAIDRRSRRPQSARQAEPCPAPKPLRPERPDPEACAALRLPHTARSATGPGLPRRRRHLLLYPGGFAASAAPAEAIADAAGRVGHRR